MENGEVGQKDMTLKVHGWIVCLLLRWSLILLILCITDRDGSYLQRLGHLELEAEHPGHVGHEAAAHQRGQEGGEEGGGQHRQREVTHVQVLAVVQSCNRGTF